MKPDTTARAALSAVIRSDMESIRRLDGRLQPIVERLHVPDPDFRDLAAAAYILHNLYNALENIFEQVSRTFENHVTDPTRWHKELLDKMYLDIPDVRPPLLKPHSKRLLNNLRGFRHVFRHSYDFEIDPLRLRLLVQEWQPDVEAILADLEAFCQLQLNSERLTDETL